MKYYYIDDIEVVAKLDLDADGIFAHYLYDAKDGWVEDRWNIVMDYIVGWEDPDEEPPGSPFKGFGHSDVMRHLREISEEEMKKRISSPAYRFTVEKDR